MLPSTPTYLGRRTLRGRVRSIQLRETGGKAFSRVSYLKSRIRIILELNHEDGLGETIQVGCEVGSRRRHFLMPKGFIYSTPVLSPSMLESPFPLIGVNAESKEFELLVSVGDTIQIRGKVNERVGTRRGAYLTMNECSLVAPVEPEVVLKKYGDRLPTPYPVDRLDRELTTEEIRKVLRSLDRVDPRPLSQRVVHHEWTKEELAFHLSASNVLIIEKEFIPGVDGEVDQFEYWGLVNASVTHPTLLDQMVHWISPATGPDSIRELISPNPFKFSLEENHEVSISAVLMGELGSAEVLEENRRIYDIQPLWFTHHYRGDETWDV